MPKLETSLGAFQESVTRAYAELRENNIMHRIWNHDHTVWADDPDELTNRLGWLRIMDVMKQNIQRIHALVNVLKREEYTNVLLLGMGGSSLAPEVFYRTYGSHVDGLQLDVLDSTDPGSVLSYDNALDISKTLFVVSTKSGTTAETLSAFKYFYNRAIDVVGHDKTGEHFIAITDPGSKLEQMADKYHFRATFLNDPDIGGRYSALSYFGIVPAALVGVDIEKLLARASEMAVNCSAENCPSDGDNQGGRLGAIMGELAKVGRDKITLILSPAIEGFGDWVEQLIAESTGKDGKGILPVVGEALASPDAYADDRLFVYLRLADDTTYDAGIQALADAGYPLVRIHLNDLYDLGGQFFLWEMATAVAGERLGIHPFNQPNVESAKKLARKMIDEYQETGKLPELTATLADNGITVYGDVSANSAGDALYAFLKKGNDGAYISLQAYVHTTEATTIALNALRIKLRDTTHYATTLGYGPRFLHSTGQLHKGDAGNGLFIQLLATMPQDVDIPDEAGESESSMSFGTLKTAQALGDREALLEVNRNVITFDLVDDIEGALGRLTESVG